MNGNGIQFFTRAEIEHELKQAKAGCVWLEDSSGRTLISKNAVGKGIGPKLVEIFNRLSSPLVPDGVYFIKGLKSHKNNSVPVSLAYKRGSGDPSQVVYTNQYNLAEGGSLAAEYVRLQGEVGRLSSENAVLRNEASRLSDKVAMLEALVDDLKAANEDLSEGAAPVPAPGAGLVTPELLAVAVPALLEFLKPSEKPEAPKPLSESPEFQQMVKNQNVLAQAVANITKLLQRPAEPEPENNDIVTEDDFQAMSEDEKKDFLLQVDPTGQTYQQYLNQTA